MFCHNAQGTHLMIKINHGRVIFSICGTSVSTLHAVYSGGINTDNFKPTTKRKREIGGITPLYCDTPRHLPWLYIVYRTEIYPCFDCRSRYSSHPAFIHARPNDPVNAEPHPSPYRIDHRKPPYARRVQLKMNRYTGPPAPNLTVTG